MQTDDPIRVNDCLYGFCKKRTRECDRCDAVKAILAKAYTDKYPDGAANR